MIRNPVLRGFNPDPSMIRVGDDYYIATSTFEWFPGVQIHHSRDLVNWRVLGYPLTRVSQLDLRGNPSSGGIWAPALSYHNGLFYLLYTDVKGRRGAFKDLHNYMVTAKDIEGPWSEPIYLHSRGFDPFLFHDDDGRKWVLNMRWDYREGKSSFGGIELQEYSSEKGKLIGRVELISGGSSLGVTEGPQLLKRNGYYYLLLAEGGTGYSHAATMARSLEISGPYEIDPDYPMLTTVNNPEHPLQKAGHGSLVETPNGEWYMAHICARPLPGRRLSPLGRETAIQRVEWTDDGWLRLAGGGILPHVDVPAPIMLLHPWPENPDTDEFNDERLDIRYQTLRIPAEENWLSLAERPGYLRLRGQESLFSWNRQSMVGRRLQHFRAEAETCVEFEPESFNQTAGLVCFSDESDHFYVRIGHDERLGKHVRVVISHSGKYGEPDGPVIVSEGWKRCYLKAIFDYDSLRFQCSPDGKDWMDVGPELDMGQLSDDYEGKLGFAGTLIGMCAQDLDGARATADFDFFRYSGIE
ncbi:glycoside hydrolase family 43 protein [Cohnella cholangitidis]|uniref:Glycoside hydrolase family 43 protein n=1 Tax=Cohnella cholangitidis TaxID=2598458 RepID=A0A7G5BVG2_9BACL|nr:glycoside hydrolase family 43 protein [Cohnella cholangitidis]QMV40946.1 glycoside hydrolase family 43 protein [Cohnella cholangitidis]